MAPHPTPTPDGTPDAPTRAVASFLAAEASGAVLLCAAAVIAFVWANSPWDAAYRSVLSVDLGLDLHAWVNDGLMTLFFLVVGLEIRRELTDGELASARLAALPAVAALGGMVVPAILFVTVTAGTDHVGAWGVPVATDIALAVGVVTLLGRRVAPAAKVFLLALAIVDDLGAIVVIAVAYSSGVSWGYLAASVAVALAIAGVARWWPTATPAFVVLGVALWWFVHEAGVHATLAGVVLAFLLPVSAARRWEPALHPWTGLLIVPVFALANAGVGIDPSSWSSPGTGRLALGIVLGLVIGKPLGITAAVWVGRRFGLRLPDGLDLGSVAAIGAVAGIGFTVSIFVADLALAGDAATTAKAAVMGASLIAGLIGSGALMLRARATARSAPAPR